MLGWTQRTSLVAYALLRLCAGTCALAYCSLRPHTAHYTPRLDAAPAELDRAADFVSKQLARRERLGEERLGDDAYLVARMEVALLRVRKAAALAGSGVPAGVAAGTALLDTLKVELAEGRELLERLGGGGAEPAVPAAYHRAASEYYKIRGPAAAFYEAALAYLGVTPISALSPEERVAMAVDVALAALVGEGVYNFGEVSEQQIDLLMPVAGCTYGLCRDLSLCGVPLHMADASCTAP